MLFAISYDIVDDQRRLRIARTLLDYGSRVQKSVFECSIESENLVSLVQRLQTMVKESEDSIRVYPICGNCKESIQILGQGQVTEDPEVYIV